jgi:prepilin-type N-terminal cleavage/methylation domain-containing protein
MWSRSIPAPHNYYFKELEIIGLIEVVIMCNKNMLVCAERTQCQSRYRAFTLVELLVVISIIALLLSILMPSLQKARQSAQTVVCKSNLKQMGYGFLLYSEDNNGYMPPSWLAFNGDATKNNFMPILSKYFGDKQKTTHGAFYDKGVAGNKVWMCPNFKKLDDFAANPTCIYSYAMNLHQSFNFDYSSLSNCYKAINNRVKRTNVDDPNFWAPLVKSMEIKRPSEKILVSDAAGWHVEFNFSSFNLVISDPAVRHNKKVNVLLSDMSVSQDVRNYIGIGGFKIHPNIFPSSMPSWYQR